MKSCSSVFLIKEIQILLNILFLLNRIEVPAGEPTEKQALPHTLLKGTQTGPTLTEGI